MLPDQHDKLLLNEMIAKCWWMSAARLQDGGRGGGWSGDWTQPGLVCRGLMGFSLQFRSEAKKTQHDKTLTNVGGTTTKSIR